MLLVGCGGGDPASTDDSTGQGEVDSNSGGRDSEGQNTGSASSTGGALSTGATVSTGGETGGTTVVTTGGTAGSSSGGSGGSETGGVGSGGEATGGTAGADTGGTSGSGSTGGAGGSSGACTVPPASCPYPDGVTDKDNRALCNAHELTLEGDVSPESCIFNDSSLTVDRCAVVSDSLCDGQSNWYHITVRAKHLFAVVPDNNGGFAANVYQSNSSTPASLNELTQIQNDWSGSPFNYDLMYVADGAAGTTVNIFIEVLSKEFPFGYELTIKEDETEFSCVDMNLTGRGGDYHFQDDAAGLQQGAFVGGLVDATTRDEPFDPSPDRLRENATACRKRLNDAQDPSSGWAQMEVVACVNGQLEVVHDCLSDFPAWSEADVTNYGELRCNINVHPDGRLWCEPSNVGDKPFGICALHDLPPGEATCVPDSVTGESRYLFGCQSNFGHYFDQDSTLYNPRSVTEGGYVTGQDCQDPFREGNQQLSAEEASRGECGMHYLSGETRCLYDREHSVNDEVDDPALWDTYDPTFNDFPNTQNLVSCAQPGDGNVVPYVRLDTLSGVYTDVHVEMSRPLIDELHARGQKYYGYLNVPSPESKTTLPGSPHLGNGAPWNTMAYQYMYWADRLGEDIGDSSGNYAALPRPCYDVDDDGVGNDVDNCPTIYNPAQAGEQPDEDEDGLGDACDPTPSTHEGNDIDADAVSQPEDNCPQIENADQADADGNGIGDACDSELLWTCDATCRQATSSCDAEARTDGICASSALPACDASLGIGCADVAGEVSAAQPMQWVFDLYKPLTQDLLIAWTKLGVLSNMDGMTYDVAVPSDCWSNDLVALFQTFAENGGSLSEDISGSTDPNHAGRQSVVQETLDEAGVSASSFDIWSYRQGLSDAEWGQSAAHRALEVFRVDFMRNFMDELKTEVDAYVAAERPGESFGLFFNQGTTTLFNSIEDAAEPGGYRNLKDVAGAETFIRSGHPEHGTYDCVGVEGAAYPSRRTLEWLFDLHDDDGLRFWSWNFPGEVPDDRPLLFAAEALSHGGISQTPFCEVEELYPYKGYTTPHHNLRRAQASLAPFMSAYWDRLNLPRRTGQVGMYLPQVINEGCYSSPEFGMPEFERLSDMLRDLNYSVDVLSGSAFAMGRADLPEVSTFQQYEFIVLAAEFLSTEEIEVLSSYLDAGGTIVATGKPGRFDEWCRDATAETGTRSTWLGYFASHGENAVGSGKLDWLDGVTAYTDPDGQSMDAAEALNFLDAPNAGTWICTPGASSCDEVGGTFDTSQLVVEDLAGERAQLRSWLETTLGSDFGLPSPRFGAALPAEVHVVEREGQNGLPVYHLLNYSLNTVAVDPWYDGDLAGVYEERVAHFGCTSAVQIPAITVPDELGATGGTVHVAALDSAPASDDFFPNACGPAAPCASPPLSDNYPNQANGFSFPETSTTFAPGTTEVAVTWPGEEALTMKQWLIVWFESN